MSESSTPRRLRQALRPSAPHAPSRVSLVVGAALTGLVLLLASLGQWVPRSHGDWPLSLASADKRLTDVLFRYGGQLKVDPHIALVAVDEKTLAALGRWPFRRLETLRLMDALGEQGAAVIAFDVIYSEQDNSAVGGQDQLQLLHQRYQELGLDAELPRGLDETLAELEQHAAQVQHLASRAGQAELLQATARLSAARARLRERWGGWAAASRELRLQVEGLKGTVDIDQELADAVQAHGRTVLGYFFFMSGAELRDLAPERRAANERLIEPSPIQAQAAPGVEALFERRPQGVMANLPSLSLATRYQGYLNVFQDEDGVLRQASLVLPHGGTFYPSLALQAYAAWLESQGRAATLELRAGPRGLERLWVGGEPLPADAQGQLAINYPFAEQPFPTFSWVDVVERRLPPGTLQGSIVLVGATASTLGDSWVTPVDGRLHGVQVHASVLNSLLTRQFLRSPPWRQGFELGALALYGALLTVALLRWRPSMALGAALLGLLTWLSLAYVLFSYRGLRLAVLPFLLLFFLLGLGLLLYRYLTEEHRRRFIQRAFGQYLSPQVIGQLMEDPGRLELGGEERVCTAFFSDVAGFSQLSEQLAPAELVRVLNEYLTEMTEIILEQEGTVDKYEGDAVVAFFGAPLAHPDHAARACVTAIRQQRRLEVLRARWQAQGRPLLHARIGLNTGRMLIGNMGSALRMSYTMMGDAVNLASRLEGANKAFGTRILISEDTWTAAREAVEARELGLLRVVGRAQPVRVYEVLEERGRLEEALRPVLEHFAQGLALYRERRFTEALEAFRAALTLRPGDGPSQAYLEHCQSLLASPPPEGWDGVLELTEK